MENKSTGEKRVTGTELSKEDFIEEAKYGFENNVGSLEVYDPTTDEFTEITEKEFSEMIKEEKET